MTTNRIVLIGDSVFDNGVYVPGQPDVLSQLQSVLPDDWTATRVAQDGAVTADVREQLTGIPEDAAHLVVSVGGNDGLQQLSALRTDPLKVLANTAEILKQFQKDYGAMLDAIVETGKPVTVCTVYGGDFQDQETADLASLGTGLINTVIESEALVRGVAVLDLRTIFTRSEDYTCAVEPSVQGGEKLARAIAAHVMLGVREETNELASHVMGG